MLTKVIDVRKRETVDAWIAETVERFGGLDGAANMAGVIGKNHGKAMVSGAFDWGKERKERLTVCS